MAVGGCAFSSDDVVVKSPNDRRLYRFIRLSNGLCALLVHDPEIYSDQPAGETKPENMESELEEEDEEEDGEEEDEDEEEDDDEEDEDEEENEEVNELKGSVEKKVTFFSTWML
ncbi:UNVERIFIED_CONTAM: Nardilysin-like [Sesamum radiatum]|uniref:Nardilysin-like n=1 Tax=Sesamum radiatum TaxID=300843 RepID=A0AAW2W1H8_SESRA